MRFYQLALSTPAGQVYQVATNGLGWALGAASNGPTFSSVYTPWQSSSLAGQPNPNALHVEFDIPVSMLHLPQGLQLIRVWGLGIQCITQAQLANLNPTTTASGKLVYNNFTLSGGMSAGLPLANPAQQGVIASGIIWQAFGNWQGTEQTLDLIVAPSINGLQGAVSLTWKKGTSLQSALTQAFQQAFPTFTRQINVSSSLIAPSDQPGIYTDLASFGQWLQGYTKQIGTPTLGDNYDGVWVYTIGTTIYASDLMAASAKPAKALTFQDLIGQPTWIDVNTIIFPTVLRGDIDVTDQVTFPTGTLLPYALTSPDAAFPNAPAASNVSFQGTFTVKELHHYGSYRNSDARSWNSTMTAIYNTVSANGQ
jgi:hypothetical protein